LGLDFITAFPIVPRCSLLGANLIATLSEKKSEKKQRTQRHILQESQQSRAQTGQAALNQANRDASLSALAARVDAIRTLMRRLKTVAFWPLVLDPTSFSSTVENMFAFAIIMDLGLLQTVEHESTGVAIVNWDFSEDEKNGNLDDDVLMGRIGDQGLNDEEAAHEQEQAACMVFLFASKTFFSSCFALHCFYRLLLRASHTCCSATGTGHINQLHLHLVQAVAGTLRRFGDRARPRSAIQSLIDPVHRGQNRKRQMPLCSDARE